MLKMTLKAGRQIRSNSSIHLWHSIFVQSPSAFRGFFLHSRQRQSRQRQRQEATNVPLVLSMSKVRASHFVFLVHVPHNFSSLFFPFMASMPMPRQPVEGEEGDIISARAVTDTASAVLFWKQKDGKVRAIKAQICGFRQADT
jgi:hypothetical protein